jgi:hypothetical protein
METLATILVILVMMAVALFFVGPTVLEKFFEKADEWAEIFDSMKDEK